MNIAHLARAVIVVVLATIAVPATADATSASLRQDLKSALSSGDNVRLNVRGRVATLTGYTNDWISKRRAEDAVASHADIDRVVNFITVSN